jgi:hypothetical protein
MRSFTPRTIAIASLFAVVPLAAAQASSSLADRQTMMDGFGGPRLSALDGQIDGVRQGIAYARQAGKIDAAQAGALQVRVDRIGATAQQVAANGRVPASNYRQLLGQLDDVGQHLQSNVGSGLNVDSHSGGGHPSD